MGALDDLMKKTGANKAKGGITSASRRLDASMSPSRPKGTSRPQHAPKPKFNMPTRPNMPARASLWERLKTPNERLKQGVVLPFAPKNTNDKNVLPAPPNLLERLGKVGTGAAKSSGGGFLNVYDMALRGIDAITPGDAGKINEQAKQAAVSKIEKQLSNPNISGLRKAILNKRLETAKKSITPKNVDKTTDKLMSGGAADIEFAKKGLPKGGRLAVDIGAGGLQLLGDVGAGLATGGSALVPMAARSFGSGAYEAEQGGGSLGQQAAYGAASAGVEMLTEKMFDGLAGAFGKGAADGIVEKVVGKLAKTNTGKTALRTIINAGGEGVEEIVSDAVNPVLRSIYNGKTPAENYKEEDVSDWLYSGLVGAAIGGIGGGVNIATGHDALQNKALNKGAGDNVQIAPQPVQPPTIAPKQNAANNVDIPTQIAPNISTKVNAPQSAVQAPAIAPNLQRAVSPVTIENATQDTVTADTKNNAVNAETHIDNRTMKSVGERKTNSFQYDHPELHQYFEYAADLLSMEVENQMANDFMRPAAKKGSATEARVGSRYKAKGAVKTLMDVGLTKPQILQCLQDIKNDRGSENYAAAKRVELALDDMMTNGYVAYTGDVAPAVVEYVKAKQAIEGAKTDEQRQAEYDEVVDLIEGTPSKSLFPENSVGAKITQLPQGTGAMSPQFAHQEAVNQQHSTDTAFTDAERQMPGLRHEDSTHRVVTDKEGIAKAKERLAFDFEGEKADLATKQDWDKADTTTAHLILRDLTEAARKSGDYSEVVKWNKTLETQKSAQGQALQANKQFANKPETIIADAAESLFGDKTKKLSDAKKKVLMDKISTSADTLDGIKQGDTASVITMIKDLSAQRKTNGMFNKEMSKTMSSALDYVGAQDWGFDFLKEIAAGQIRSVATDYKKTGFWNSVKSIRFSNMLSSFATVFRNLGGNQAFDVGDSVSNNIAIPFDILLSKLSGNRAVAVDASWFSKAKRQGSIDGFLKSFVQVGLDIDVDNVQSKYETTPGRTFKMTGNPMERFLSTVQKWQGYALQSTDEFAKGGTKAEAQRGIDKLKRRGLTDKNALQDRATEIAKERTFQNAGTAAKAVLGIRSAMNEAHFTDSQGGTFGVGDLMVPFAQVPANLGEQAVNATPLGLAKSLTQFASAVGKAKQGKLTADQQAHIATNLGRGLTGTAGFAFFTGLALKGVLKVVGSDDKDKDALERSEGQSGTQLNLDALMRWAKGDNVEWQSGDKLVNMGFLEHLNVQMAGGALIAEAYKDDKTVSAKDVTKASVQSVFQTVLELPAISQIRDLVDGYRYSKAEDVSGKLADAGGSYLGGQASSFVVPNLVAGVARGLDPKVRDTHSSDSVVQQTRDDIFSKIPGLRQTLPTKLDPWGNERTTGDNSLLRFINSTVLPAKVNQYQTSDINKEMFRLDYGGADVKFPARKMVNKLSNNGENFDLNIKEQTQFHNKSHKLANQYMSDAIKDSQYKEMSNGEKADFLSDMYSLAIDMAKREYFTNKGIEYSSDYDKALKIQEAGMKPATFFYYKNAIKEERPEGGNPTQLQVSRAINNLELSNEDKGTLWDIQTKKPSDKKPSDKNPFTGPLAREGLEPDKTIEIMDAFSYIENGMEDYVKAPNGPSAAHVRAVYFRQWLYSAGYNAPQVAYIEDVFKTWLMIPVDKPSKKAAAFVAANPIN